MMMEEVKSRVIGESLQGDSSGCCNRQGPGDLCSNSSGGVGGADAAGLEVPASSGPGDGDPTPHRESPVGAAKAPQG